MMLGSHFQLCVHICPCFCPCYDSSAVCSAKEICMFGQFILIKTLVLNTSYLELHYFLCIGAELTELSV